MTSREPSDEEKADAILAIDDPYYYHRCRFCFKIADMKNGICQKPACFVKYMRLQVDEWLERARRRNKR